MSRITNEQRIAEAWRNTDQAWPPAIGDKLRLFQPKSCRGKVVKVIAVGDQKTRTSTRLAPEGKVRIQFRSGTIQEQFAVAKTEVFPKEFTLKQLQNILN